MNIHDKILVALTPGSIFNGNQLVWRSLSSLASFSGLEEDAVVELLAGDLAQEVTCKPSKKGKGVLVALKANLLEEDGPVVIAGGPAFNAPAHTAEVPVNNPLAEALGIHQEMDAPVAVDPGAADEEA